jgi:hypothetical protein
VTFTVTSRTPESETDRADTDSESVLRSADLAQWSATPATRTPMITVNHDFFNGRSGRVRRHCGRLGAAVTRAKPGGKRIPENIRNFGSIADYVHTFFGI